MISIAILAVLALASCVWLAREVAATPVVDESKCKNRHFLVDGVCEGMCAFRPPCCDDEDR